jgi:hypothetical protein
MRVGELVVRDKSILDFGYFEITVLLLGLLFSQQKLKGVVEFIVLLDILIYY